MKVDADVLGSPTLIVRMVSVDVRQHWTEHRAQELCDVRGGRPGFPVSQIVFKFSVDVKQHWSLTAL